MTENRKFTQGVIRRASDGLSSFRMEAEKCAKGIRIRLAGIVGVNDFSEECIEITNHGGRVTINGKRLSIIIFENNQIEICGKVEKIGFAYGKN